MTLCRVRGYRRRRGAPIVAVVTAANHRSPPRPRLRELARGLPLICAGVAVAYLINQAVPELSALTVAVVLGVLAGSTPLLTSAARSGLEWATRKMLRTGVVLLGLQLAIGSIIDLGAGAVAAVVITVAVGFGGTLLLGRLIGVPRGMSLLVATGFSICGASAIAAIEGVIRRRDSDVATAIALVTLYGGLAIVAIPLCGPLLGMHGVELGEWAGVSVHEVAQVVAASSPAGAAAVAAAAVVKLTRVVLLAPVVAGVGLVERRAPHVEPRRPPLVPLFVLGFLAMVGVRSAGILPDAALAVAKTATTLLLAGALFGLGCSVNMSALRKTGPRALLLGLASTVLVASVGAVTLSLFG
jgi:uncharacterized integral membrane protein (TIGR00698 family)